MAGEEFDFGGLPRRHFLKMSAAAVLGTVFAPMPVMAGPFTREDFDHLVPANKKLNAQWVDSLFARGEPQVFRGRELEKIGMPVGGICAGQLYLGGDGSLWHWDIFNLIEHTGDTHYRSPVSPASPLDQGFAIRVKSGGVMRTRRLRSGEWSDITFRGEYPIGIVNYGDSGSPVTVRLEAYSPFIPLNTEDSALPVTILEFEVRNTSASSVEAVLCGWLENAIGLKNSKKYTGTRRNVITRHAGRLTTMDCSASADAAFADEADFGTMTLGLLGKSRGDDIRVSAATAPVFEAQHRAEEPAESALDQKLVGALGRKLKLRPGKSAKVVFLVAWRFPALSLQKLGRVGREYANRFGSSASVAEYVAKNFGRLSGTTRLWRDTWYDSTLPYWFLDRTFLNTSILASSTCYRFADGRFYGWEGVGCCEGTCGHVYHYAHAIARTFPELERIARERVDFGLAQQSDGAIHFRGEFNDFPAVDGQAGTILRALREHQMSSDSGFLRRTWPKIKLATEWLVAKDGDGDGLIESAQHNTLDTNWYGKVAWLSGLYMASLLAAAEMADEMADTEFAGKCRGIVEVGRKNFVEQLFDAEYFINKVDPAHLDAINSGTGCEIDQVFGQSWAFQVGLPRLLPEKETRSALKSLWRYNFSPDVGPYRNVYKPGRWYALAGEAGLLMCTFPRRGWDYAQARGKGPEWAAGYFNECMNGFEHQVAGHMLREGLTLEGLAIERALHDRYHPARRNPWNEVECGDHYARSMASYGVFLGACGFQIHGPKGQIGFAPRLSPENFKSAFTAPEGWGAYSQRVAGNGFQATIGLRWGKLTLSRIALEAPPASEVRLSLKGKAITTSFERKRKRLLVTLREPLTLRAGDELKIQVV